MKKIAAAKKNVEKTFRAKLDAKTPAAKKTAQVEFNKAGKEYKEAQDLVQKSGRVVNAKEPAQALPPIDYFYCSDNPEDPTYSSSIASGSYDPTSKFLAVAFRKKDAAPWVYLYDGTLIGFPPPDSVEPLGFPEDIWLKWKAAGSKGSFFQQVIAKRFKGVKYLG